MQMTSKIPDNKSLIDIHGEVWVNIIGHPNYQVSNFQRIKSLSRKWDCGLGWEVRSKDKIILGSINSIGYRTVNLIKKDKPSQILFHRVMAKAFIPNPENKPNINHKNGDKLDNSLENLEWCTQSENVRHSYRNGFQIGKQLSGEFNHRSKPIICVEKNIKFSCSQEAGRYFNTNPSHISAVCRGERKRAIGLTFKFI